MENEPITITRHLVALAGKKLEYLQALNKSLDWFYQTLENGEPGEILEILAEQEGYRAKIDEIDRRYRLVQATGPEKDAGNPPEDSGLTALLQEKKAQYQALLAQVAELNTKTVAKTQELMQSQKEKIKTLNRKKSAISNFGALGGNHQIGNIYDYKEGK